MPKIRGIKPEFWTDEKVVEVSPLARLLFIGLWNFACDNGHVEDKPKQLKMRILSLDECDVDALLGELAAAKLIERGDGIITIPRLAEHQRIDRRFFLCCDAPGCAESEAVRSRGEAGRFGNHQRWHVARGIVEPGCDFCPQEPVVDPMGPIANTMGAHRGPDVRPSGSRRGLVADGDGDGELTPPTPLAGGRKPRRPRPEQATEPDPWASYHTEPIHYPDEAPAW